MEFIRRFASAGPFPVLCLSELTVAALSIS